MLSYRHVIKYIGVSHVLQFLFYFESIVVDRMFYHEIQKQNLTALF